jgi:AraC-like DNA-binding protein
MILTYLPDLPPRPETNTNAEFRRRFYARWGRENAVICGRSSNAEYAPMTQTLSIKMAWDGLERYRLARREVGVDDDSYLILNEGSAYGSVLKAPSPTWTFAVFMRPGLHREVHAARRLAAGPALAELEPRSGPVGFSEHLHRHDALVTPHLRAIRDAVLAGEQDEAWLEERLTLLLDAMFAAEEAGAAKVQSLGRAKASTRREIARRLRLAADYMDTCYADPIDLEATARIACLSRFHLVRFFRALYGVTPHAYLLQRRSAVARRLIRGGDDLDTVAAKSGFGSRSSLRRALARGA